jgi:hypothetical protein
MIELNSTRSLEIILDGAITTNQLPFTATYIDHDPAAPSTTLTPADGQTNNTTAVTMVSAPAVGIQRTIKRVNVYNADTAQATVTIRINNGGTMRVQLTVTIQTGERIEYEDGEGFRVFTVTGAVKVTAVQSTVEPGYIDGLQMRWVSGTALTISSGTAYIPSVGANVNLPADVNLSSLSLSASTWYHAYLYLNAGVPAVELVTTAPSTPYNGTARTKSADTTRRYIGSVKTDASSNIFSFLMVGNTINYRATGGGVAPFRCLNNGTATVATEVSLAGIIPVTAFQTQIFIQNLTTNNAFVTFNAPGDAQVHVFIPNRTAGTFQNFLDMYTDANQAVQYNYDIAPATLGAFIDVFSYTYSR